MKRIGVDLSDLPEVDVFQFLLYVLTIFQSGRMLLKINLRQLFRAFHMQSFAKTQINDQGKKFENQVLKACIKWQGQSKGLLQYTTHSYGLYERQNCTIKDSLIKVLEEFSFIQKNISR